MKRNPMERDEEIKQVKQYFRSLTDMQRQKEKAHYEYLLAVERDEIPPKKNIITGKVFRPIKMPWMIPAWESGLKLLNEVIEELKEDW